MSKRHRNGQMQKSAKQEQKAHRRFNIQVLLLILMIIIGLSAIFAVIKIYAPNLFGKASLSGELAATVDERQITMAELDESYNRLPVQYRAFITKEDLLTQMINEELLRNDAVRNGLTVTDAEVEESIAQFKKESNITDEQMKELLQERNMDMNGLRQLIRGQMLVSKELEAQVTNKTQVTDEEAQAYYEDNVKLFEQPEQVVARHILIAVINRTDEDADTLSQDVMGRVKSDRSNFCELVTTYSDDTASVPDCGRYEFGRGELDPDFEEVAFSQDAGELGIAKTIYGYHVILTDNRTQARTLPFEEVKDGIIAALSKNEQKEVYDLLITRLQSQAEIVNYLNPNATIAQNSPATTENVAEETTTSPVNPPQEQQPEEQTSIQPPEQVSNAAADCLADKEVVLYGAFWDSSTKKQKDMLGEALGKIDYVECGVEGRYDMQSDACRGKIDGYPTWMIEGKTYLGSYTLDQVTAFAGCR